MAVSTSLLAYSDCFELMERAINETRGIRIKFATYEDAYTFRIRVHKARRLDRGENRNLYAEGHKLHGHSIYDQLSCKIRVVDDVAWLRIERMDAKLYIIESLDEEPVPKVPPALIQTMQGVKKPHVVESIKLNRRRI